MLQHQTPPEFETSVSPDVEFIPMERDRRGDGDHVSREVPPPADEAGAAETHEPKTEGAVWYPGRSEAIAADPGMDIDVIESPEVELQELFNVVTRVIQEEVKQHESDSIGVVRALGGCANQYRRERKAAVRAIVS